jgi:ABC-type transport system involved in multi-copper enzyme maturation permease subunit
MISGRPTAAMVRLDLFSTLTALAPYAVVAVAAALTGFVLQNDLNRVQEDGLLVISDPFAVSLYGGVLLLSVYLAAAAAMVVAREREQGAVELLSYGPVSAFSYLLAKFTSHVLQYMILVVLLLGSYLLLAVATGLRLRGSTLLAMALSIGPAAAAAALGLLVAALIRRVRPTILAVLGLALGTVGLQVAREVLVRLPSPEFHVNPVQLLRWAAVAVSSITQWLLPFGYVDRELSSMLRGDLAEAVGVTVVACVYAVLVLALAAAGLARTGIRR